MTINTFKTLRVYKGFTLAELSEVLGINKASLSKKERGLLPFNIREIKVIKEIFKLTPTEIDDIFFK